MPYLDDSRRGQTESPVQAQQQKVANLYADVQRLFGNLAQATDPASHGLEEIERNQSALASELDKAIDSHAQALKELARL